MHFPGTREKFFFFLSGIIISVPFPLLSESYLTRFLLGGISARLTTLIVVSVFAPLLEEFAKAYPLFYRHGESQKSLLTLGFFTGFGFGLTEFFIYVFALSVPPLFRLPALLFHATNTMITAYGVAGQKAFRYYLLAVLLHAINNYSSFLGQAWILAGVSVTLISYMTAFYLYRRSSQVVIAY